MHRFHPPHLTWCANAPPLLVHAFGVTAVVVAGALAARAAAADTHAHLDDAAADLVQRALQWREAAVQDTDPALRLQHAAAAHAYMAAARALARDTTLEQRVGVDVARLARSMERRVGEARQILRPHAPAMPP